MHEFVGYIRFRANRAGGPPAAWMLAGVDRFTLSKLLRHASIAMTERYTHLSRGDLKAALNRKPVSE